MTPLRTMVRTGAAWFLPLLFALSCAYAAPKAFRNAYPAGNLAQASISLYAAAPAVAAFVAFQFRGFAPFARDLRSVRRGLTMVWRAWWPLLLGTPMTACVAVAVAAVSVPNDVSSWAIMTIDFMTILAAALTGLVCAWALPAVVAIPLSAIGWFAWIDYGPASSSELVHNLDGTFGAGPYETQPARIAIWATTLLLLTIIVGIASLLSVPQSLRLPRPAGAAALSLLLVAGFGLGTTILLTSSRKLNLMAVEPRTTALVCTTEKDIGVCLWPETTASGPGLAAIVVELNPSLHRHGLATIDELTQGERDPGAVSVVAGPDLARRDLQASVAYGYVDQQSHCTGGYGAAHDDLTAVIAALAHMAPDDVATRFGASAAATARRVLTRAETDPLSVGRWFHANLPRIRCTASS